MMRRTIVTLLGATALLVAGCHHAEEAQPVGTPPATTEQEEADEKSETAAESAAGKDSVAAWTAEAKVTDVDARKMALALVPGGTIKEGGIERENGKLVYSFDIAVPGKSGIEEIQIDALTGKVVSQAHETPEDEAKEAAGHSAKSKAPMPSPPPA